MSNQQYRHAGRKLTPSELVELLTDQHAAMVDDPIMLWLSISLEDMADVVTRAIDAAEAEPEVDKYGNPMSGDSLPFCCFPDCGCDGARLCMAESGAHSGALALNIERGA